MKKMIKLLGLTALVLTQVSALNTSAQSQQQSNESWKNRYTIIANDVPANAVIYARQMGYDHIGIKPSFAWQNNNVYKTDSINNPNQKLSFFMIDPYYDPQVYAAFPQPDLNGRTVLNIRMIDVTPVYNPDGTRGTNSDGTPRTVYCYTQAQKNWYNQRMVWKNTTAQWPNNLANGGWGWLTNYTRFAPFWDFQQQAVIKEVVDNILAAAANFVAKTSMPFAGVYFDVPTLTGVFYSDGTGIPATPGITTLKYWTGGNYGVPHIGIDGTSTKQYTIYSDGMAAFYKDLNARMKGQWSNAKWLIEPARLWNWNDTTQPWTVDEYVNQVSNRSDKDLLTPDMLSEEGPTTEFVDNFNNTLRAQDLASMAITKNMVGSQMSSGPNIAGEVENRTIAGKAGINGAWFNWSLTFGTSGTVMSWTSIKQVYPRLKLIKCIPNWDNLTNVPLGSRSWNGSVYQSTNSYISSDVMYSRHWKTGKLFAVFNTTNGVINLKPGETALSAYGVDGYFIEAGSDVKSGDFSISGNQITLTRALTATEQAQGAGYIFTLSQSTSAAPTATTNSETNRTATSATLNGNVNPNGSSTNVHFDYGTTSGSYYGKINANPNSISASSGTTSVGANLTGLSPNTTYYYRVAATNSAGTTNGSEMSFTTLDSTAPSVPQNLTATAISSSRIDLSWSASNDNVGVAGYRVYRGTNLIASITSGTTYSNIGLSANTNYYYTISAYDAAGNASAQSSPAGATTAAQNSGPTGSLQINYGTLIPTNSERVYLNLAADDPDQVNAYYASESNTAPPASSPNWKSVAPSANYSGFMPYYLSPQDGSKTVYVWYRDILGNLSSAYSASIVLAKDESWKNIYAIAWRDNAFNSIKYAKQMGYDHIAIMRSGVNVYNTQGVGLSFYLTDPYYDYNLFATLPKTDAYGKTILNPRVIDVTPGSGFVYTQAQKDWYSKRMTWKDAKSTWPDMFACGGNPPPYVSTKFQPTWDFQQQAVIDEVVNGIIASVNAYKTNTGMSFAGYISDVAAITGVFYRDTANPPGGSATLALWTGTDSGVSHVGLDGTTIKQFTTYSNGMAQYHKQLSAETKKTYSNAKWGLEPSWLYNPQAIEEWIYTVSQRLADRDSLAPDILLSEGATTEFIDDFNDPNRMPAYAGMKITKDMVGSAQSSKVEELVNRRIAAKAGKNGAWFNWFGRFGGVGTMPDFQSITQVYPRLKLIRVIPNWDNLNGIAVDPAHRVLNNNTSLTNPVYDSYDANGYQQSRIDGDVMYSRHPGTANLVNKGKLFVVFNSTNGVVTLKAGEAVLSTQRVDGYFIESGDGSADVNVVGNTIKLKSNFTVAVDASNGQIMGNGYIFTLGATGSLAPVITSALTSTGTVGTALSYQITAANSPTSFNAAGLPAGLSVNTVMGLISGTPATIGTSSVAISAANAGGTGAGTLTLSVYSACDVNRDGSTDVADVQLQVNAALGAAACTSDLNGDGSCSVIDVQRGVNTGLGGQCVVGP